MNGVNWSNVDKAIARGDVIAPEVWNWIDAILAPLRPLPDTRLSSIQTVASNDAEKQAAIADVAIVDAPPPQIEIDPAPLTDNIDMMRDDDCDNTIVDDEPRGVYDVDDPALEYDAAPVPPQFEAEISVVASVGEGASAVGESAFAKKRKSSTSNKSSNRGAKRNPKAVQQVLDYLMLNPDDIALTVAQLTDKLRYDVRMKVGHSSVGKAMGIMKADGKASA